MSTLSIILISILSGIIIGLIGGIFLGAFIAVNFDVVNNSYIIEKLRAKKNSQINIEQLNHLGDTPETKPKKEKLFKRIFKRKNK